MNGRVEDARSVVHCYTQLYDEKTEPIGGGPIRKKGDQIEFRRHIPLVRCEDCP